MLYSSYMVSLQQFIDVVNSKTFTHSIHPLGGYLRQQTVVNNSSRMLDYHRTYFNRYYMKHEMQKRQEVDPPPEFDCMVCAVFSWGHGERGYCHRQTNTVNQKFPQASTSADLPPEFKVTVNEFPFYLNNQLLWLRETDHDWHAPLSVILNSSMKWPKQQTQPRPQTQSGYRQAEKRPRAENYRERPERRPLPEFAAPATVRLATTGAAPKTRTPTSAPPVGMQHRDRFTRSTPEVRPPAPKPWPVPPKAVQPWPRPPSPRSAEDWDPTQSLFCAWNEVHGVHLQVRPHLHLLRLRQQDQHHTGIHHMFPDLSVRQHPLL